MLLCLYYDFSTYKKINTSSWIYRLMNAAAGNNVYMAFFFWNVYNSLQKDACIVILQIPLRN